MDTTQIILIVVIALLLIAYPIMITVRNRKENQRMLEQTNSLKRGDKVLTTSGVYGTIVDLQLEQDRKIVTIETGTDKKKGYISVDAYSIYTIVKDEEVAEPAKEQPNEDKPVQAAEENKTDEKPVEVETKATNKTKETKTKKKNMVTGF